MEKHHLILPNFFIAGAAKSATSSLNDYLRQHSEIYMSEVKEPHFFGWDKAYQKGLDSYAFLFVDGTGFKARGESSTGYMVFPNVIERIKSTISEPCFIFILVEIINITISMDFMENG